MRDVSVSELCLIAGGTNPGPAPLTDVRRDPSTSQIIGLVGGAVFLGIGCSPPGIAASGGLACAAAAVNFIQASASILENVPPEDL